MAIENIATIIVGLVSLAIPIYIFIKGNDRKASILYAILGILAGPIWAFTLAFFRESTDYDQALIWDKLIYLNASFIGPLFLTFSLVFPIRQNISKFLLSFLVLSNLFFLYIIITSDNFIKEIILNDQGNSVRLGYFYTLWVVWFASLMSLGVLKMLKSYRSLQGTAKDQARFMVIGAIPPSIGTLPTNAFLPLFGIYEYIWLGPFFLFFMNIIVAYGLTRIRFFGRSELIKFFLRPLIFFLITLVLVLLVFIVVDNKVDSQIFAYSFLISITITGMIIVLDKLIEQQVLPYFIKRKFDPIKIRDEFLSKTSKEMNLEKITETFINMISYVFQTSRIGYIVFDEEKDEIIFSKLNNINSVKKKTFLDIFSYFETSQQESSPVVLAEQEYILMQKSRLYYYNRLENLLKFMREEYIQIVFPIKKGMEYKALCFIGNKENDDNYKVEEIELLIALINNLGVVTVRALLYNQIKSFTLTLKEKVELQTKELNDKVVALEESRRRERDMIDIMGHELRTPMSIVKGSFSYLQYILKKLIPANSDHETMAKYSEYIDRIDENIEREVKLIEILLSSTKVDSGKLELEFEPVDIIDVIEDGILGQKKNASQKGLKLYFTKPVRVKNYPQVFADRTRIQEIVDNLLSNAVKYTEEGNIRVSLSKDEKYVYVHIKDTGIGISKEDLKKIGTKFYRVNQYTSENEKGWKMVRSGGTGLGLYVTFGLVKAHKGKIWVESEMGKGSIFHFTIPIAKKEKISSKNDKSNDAFVRLGLKK